MHKVTIDANKIRHSRTTCTGKLVKSHKFAYWFFLLDIAIFMNISVTSDLKPVSCKI